jgi:antimicrobial peptide system SdpB family protein
MGMGEDGQREYNAFESRALGDQMLRDADRCIRGALERYEPWTNVYGLARSILALATAGTLAANPVDFLFRPGSGMAPPPICDRTRSMGAFCFAGPHHLELCRWLCVAMLLLVASGWRPRLTAIPHWWIAFSLQANAMVVDGGDQVSAVLTLLILPVALTDARRSHWNRTQPPTSETVFHRKLWAFLGHSLLRLQVAGIYFHAAVGKLTVPEWKDGTAMYYWGTHETFGSPSWLDWAFRGVITAGWSVALFTWSVILLELLLSVGLAIDRRYQSWLLAAGIIFHFGIIFVHGLASFGTTMIAALILYLRPWSQDLSIPVEIRGMFRRRKDGETCESPETRPGVGDVATG